MYIVCALSKRNASPEALATANLNNMSGATEIGICYLKPGTDPVGNPDSAEGKVMKDALSLVLQQKGAQRAFAGKEEENPNIVRLFIDWDTIEDHVNFTKSE